MSIKLIQQAWDSDLKGNDLLVLIALADNASDEGYCWPSWQSIMSKTKVSRGTLSSVLNRLESGGYIARESRKRDSGSDASNGYFILQNKQSSRFEHHQNKGRSSEIEHHNDGGRSSEIERGGVQKLNPQSSESEHLYEPSYNRQLEPSVNTPKSPSETFNAQIVETDHIPYSEIIDHLNMILSSGFRHSSKKTQAMIKARWNEGFRLGDFQYVHMVKAMEWGNDEKMSKFLRPETLYSDKFEGYRNQKLPRRAYGEQMQAQLESQGFQNVFDYLESMPQSNQQVISA